MLWPIRAERRWRRLCVRTHQCQSSHITGALRVTGKQKEGDATYCTEATAQFPGRTDKQRGLRKHNALFVRPLISSETNVTRSQETRLAPPAAENDKKCSSTSRHGHQEIQRHRADATTAETGRRVPATPPSESRGMKPGSAARHTHSRGNSKNGHS